MRAKIVDVLRVDLLFIVVHDWDNLNTERAEMTLDELEAEQEFSVEHGIPIKFMRKYPFHKMAVGDSFFVPDGKWPGRTLANAAYFYGKTTGTKFSVRKVDGGARCWRIA